MIKKTVNQCDFWFTTSHATVVLFLLYLIELLLAYFPFYVTQYCSRLSNLYEIFVPALRIPLAEETKAYMALTLSILPIKIYLLFFIEWREKKYFDFMPLPWKGERICKRMITSLFVLIIFVFFATYFCLGEGVAELSVNGFLYKNYNGLGVWFGWVLYRMTALGYLLAVVIIAGKVWIKKPERINNV